MPVMVTRECLAPDCATRYDLLTWSDGTQLSQDNEPPTDISCPKCHSEQRKKVVAVGRAIWMGDEAGHGSIYPYNDVSLGLRIHSKKHHDKVMRDRGLQHTDANTVEREWADVEADYAEAKATMDEWDDEIAHHPDYQSYRQMADKGKFTDDLPVEFREIARKKLLAQFER